MIILPAQNTSLESYSPSIPPRAYPRSHSILKTCPGVMAEIPFRTKSQRLLRPAHPKSFTQPFFVVAVERLHLVSRYASHDPWHSKVSTDGTDHAGGSIQVSVIGLSLNSR